MHEVRSKECQLLSSYDTINKAIDEACRLRILKQDVYVVYKLGDGEKTRGQKQSERIAEQERRQSKIHKSRRDDSGDEMHDERESNPS